MFDERECQEVLMEDGAIYRGWVEDLEPNGWGAMTFPDEKVFIGYFGQGEPAMSEACAVLFPDRRVRIGFHAAHAGKTFATELSPDGVFRAGATGDGLKVPLRESDAVLDNQGVMMFPDGRVYVGEFSDGKVGHGRLPAEGILPAEGTLPAWGILTGVGRLPAQLHGQGPFRYGNNPHGGDGVMLFPDGRVYVGEFSDGMPDGYGSMISPGGEVHTGNFRDGEPEAA